ncbi:MAG: porin family protein [Acetobacteraceae bacterium]|nr:porin family protein [Methylobacteriaceae bacterium]MBV8575920.1 porin family protein [Acetobacteraceae bacterium]
MYCSRFFVALVPMVALLVPSAFPADLGPSPIEPAQEVEPLVELGTGWYLRGDIGYSLNQSSGFARGGVQFANGKLANSWTGTLGGGYQLNSWFRTDITVDYRGDLRLSGRGHVSPAVCLGTFSGCDVFHNTKLSAATGLWNAYVDLGTWSGFTPYVGAGVGASVNRMTNVSNIFINDDTGLEYPGLSNVVGRHVTTQFAWALMAGAAVSVAPHTQVDFGYRFLDLGRFRSFAGIATPPFTTKSLQANEFRIGLRYMID